MHVCVVMWCKERNSFSSTPMQPTTPNPNPAPPLPPPCSQVALLQLSALPPAGAGPDATAAALNLSANPAAAVAGRAALTALTRLGLAGQSTLPGRRTQTVMHSLVRGGAPDTHTHTDRHAYTRNVYAGVSVIPVWGASPCRSVAASAAPHRMRLPACRPPFVLSDTPRHTT